MSPMWNVVVTNDDGALYVWLPWDGMPEFPSGYYKGLVSLMLVSNLDPEEDSAPIIEGQPADSNVLCLRLSSGVGPAYQAAVIELIGNGLYEKLIDNDETVDVGGRYAFVEGVEGKPLRISLRQLDTTMKRILEDRFSSR